MHYIVFFAGLILGLGAGFFFGKVFVDKSIEEKFQNKLAEIEAEVTAIEQQADRRIVPAIHAVTKRVRGLL